MTRIRTLRRGPEELGAGRSVTIETVRILFAGATGVLGRATLPHLHKHHVVGLTRSAERVQLLGELGAEAVVCDVFGYEDLVRVTRRARPQTVVHFIIGPPHRIHGREQPRAPRRRPESGRCGGASGRVTARRGKRRFHPRGRGRRSCRAARARAHATSPAAA